MDALRRPLLVVSDPVQVSPLRHSLCTVRIVQVLSHRNKKPRRSGEFVLFEVLTGLTRRHTNNHEHENALD